MAAVPVSLPASAFPSVRVRSLPLTERRLAANRRNARRSTGPRSPEGKAKVARNPIKHGFFVAPEKWSPAQFRDFEKLREGLREEFAPQSGFEEGCVATVAASYVRMAALLRWENIAALKYHQQCERELEEQIAAADAGEASRLKAHREHLRGAGLWRPTLPGPRETTAIIRYTGRLDRTIRQATSELEASKKLRLGEGFFTSRLKKQTHFSASPALRENAKTNPFGGSPDKCPEALRRASTGTQVRDENEKANPLSSMFMGNRHERRRAKAMARRQT